MTPRSKELSRTMREKSRGRLVAAACSVFAEKGYFKSTVKDIAAAANMSTGNLYWHFGSKEGLLKAVLEEGFGATLEATSESASNGDQPLAAIISLIERLLMLHRDRSDFATLLLSLMAHSGPGFFRELGFDLEQIGAQYHAHLTQLFAAARAEGVVADLDPELLVVFFFSFLNGLVVTYRDSWHRFSIEEFRNALLRMLGIGIGGACIP